MKTLLKPVAVWVWLTIGAAVLAIAGSVIALVDPSIYARLTPAFLPQALAQDVANLAIASPALLILAVLTLRGSLRSYLLWLGVVAFTVYNYVIYTFAVPFGALFLVWVAVLCLCIYALIGGIVAVDPGAIQARYTSRPAVMVAAWALILTAVFFAFLWLSEDVPALLSGTHPPSVTQLGVPTNPVHILDLGFFLPAAILSGVWLLLRRPLAFNLAPAFLVFLMLTGIPILLTPAIQVMRGEMAEWGVVAPIGTLTILLIALLAWLVSNISRE